MPHLVILYTSNLEAETDFSGLCRELADAMLATDDDDGQPVFPTGGVRVLAYPARHFAVADGTGDHAFCYFQLRIGKGRSAAVHRRVGHALVESARTYLAPVLARRHVGLTLHVDEAHPVFDGRFGNLHDLFSR
jgi:5-carboxymethyl-2-hydroxymuconate isomerase